MFNFFVTQFSILEIQFDFLFRNLKNNLFLLPDISYSESGNSLSSSEIYIVSSTESTEPTVASISSFSSESEGILKF